jgi:hypothetical protein
MLPPQAAPGSNSSFAPRPPMAGGSVSPFARPQAPAQTGEQRPFGGIPSFTPRPPQPSSGNNQQ